MKERILAYLEKDARMTPADIATMLGANEEEVKKIIEECEAEIFKNDANIFFREVFFKVENFRASRGPLRSVFMIFHIYLTTRTAPP